ncbi:TetR/AcrR family transcriptional regulator [Microbacterium fluvii]|uniref:TetR/AcrR family transcriptional regulator n=1 Tax=Microbacterium fluvii TaxID=415215 RepID=A0ABW2HG12_9MICO|nr:TetR/AcrR family transcriptional regulator [Microbacterium fluvii]MCU4673097.1 TetR family transcriptional regulator [Microbacterium fluvii]
MTSTAAADPVRRRDPERTRRDILAVATTEFAANGYDGARVDEIAAQTQTTKRMIYYYFESKEQLYLRVLEGAYQVIRELEQTLDVAHLEPVAALRRLAEATFDHHTTHRDFIRLVSIENIHRAEHMATSAALTDLNQTAIATLSEVLRRGVADGVFRDDVDALDVHAAISSYAFFHVANRHTFGVLFGRDLLDPSRHDHSRRIAGDLVVGLMAQHP